MPKEVSPSPPNCHLSQTSQMKPSAFHSLEPRHELCSLQWALQGATN